MKKFAKKVAAVAVAIGMMTPVLTQTADAQNYGLRPAFGSVSLNAGFLPDPFRRNRIQAGGDNHFSGSQGCPGGGWFANAPDFRLFYRSGGYPLSIYVTAPGDTMLLVNDPNTRWFCNDDNNGLDPAIRFNNPQSGQYDIWVGTYQRGRVRNATIHISER